MTAVIGEAPPLARANFDVALWACAVPRDLAVMTPREYAGWLDVHAPLHSPGGPGDDLAGAAGAVTGGSGAASAGP